MKKLLILTAAFWTTNIFAQNAQDLFFIERGDTVFLTASRNARSGETDDWLTTQHGARVKIAEGVIAELLSASLSPQSVFAQFDIKSFERLSGNIFLLIPNDASKQFELSRELSQNSAIKYAHPNLIRERRAR